MHLIDPIEPLNLKKIQSAIEPEQQIKINQIMLFDAIDSTNTYLLSQAKEGAKSGLVCLAEQQTQGRGRLGRVWLQGAGNIYCSVLWRFSAAHSFSGLSIAVAVMLAETLRKFGIQSGIQLKWPNDILFAERKLAGILLESNEPTSVVIGIGLNMTTPPESLSAIGLRDILKEAERNYLIGLMLNELGKGLSQYERSGLKTFQSLWNEYDFVKNHVINLITPQKTLTGTALGINEKGELLVKEEEGVINAFSYGEVSIRIKK